ncbi:MULTISPECIES: HAD family hydrolase [Pseudomonas]|uniref:HAD family hydrolase n=1 Tax=Pseudomonas TaxID=286 RepID=UPI00076CBF5B|nr:hypothetical protein PFLuk1_02960 [Pseudomonas fluorescens]
MAHSRGLEETASVFGIKLEPIQLIELQSTLDRELESIKCFDDALPAIERLQEHGIKVGVCSNLAGPYCSRVRCLLPGLDAYALSAETGVLKPDPEMYGSVCAMLDTYPGQVLGSETAQVLMIGDFKRCDELGPRSFGIVGHHLDRNGGGGLPESDRVHQRHYSCQPVNPIGSTQGHAGIVKVLWHQT